MTGFTHGYCAMCEKHDYVGPLHGERGGPRCCLLCIGKWDAEHNPRRRARRGAIKALKAYESTGGRLFGKDFDQLKLVASGYFSDNDVSDDFKDLTSELLTAILALTHPDRHPPERKDEAQRVTQELLALKPFVFPAPEPEPPPKPSDACSNPTQIDLNKPSRPDYPCEDCRGEVPSFYCDPCKAQWEKEQAEKRKREERERKRKNKRQRERYREHKKYHALRAKPTVCATCSETFKSKRADAKFCSAACRQRAYVKREGNLSNSKPLGREDIERTISNAFTSNPDGAFSTDDLCDRVYLGLSRPNRKHRASIIPVAKKVCERLGEHWQWWRSEHRGGALVFFNHASVMSYAIGRLKVDLYKCRPGSTEEELKAEISPGGRYHHHVVEGGAWWKHCQEDIAEFKRKTDNQNITRNDLTSRHEAAA